MKVVILQSNYVPWRGYFDLINTADIFCFYDDVKYTKQDWRNRNKIYSKNGLHWITIPVTRNSVKKKIIDVQILDDKWQKKHYQSICQAYSKAPYFESILPILNDIFIIRKWNNLSHLNRYFIKKICDYIGIMTKLVKSSDYKLIDGKINRLLDLVQQVGGNEYISGPSGRNYLRSFENNFVEKNVKLTFKSYEGYPIYKQNKLPFENQVSIIDLLCFVSQDKVINNISASPVNPNGKIEKKL